MVYQNIQARLFITYLKGKSELMLYVKPQGTRGSRMIYRRSPGDAAMNLRIQSLLDHAGVLRSQLEIWIMLYPPEVQTTTLYAPRNMPRFDLHELIREHTLANLPYSINYDWENYLVRRRDNGDGTDMVTVTIVGRTVLPRVRALLYKNFSKVTFLGDGLQFLMVNERQFPYTQGRFYQVILPYDELFYLAGFRSGVHISSCALTHANSAFFGHYRLEHQQAYLDCRQNGTPVDWPQIQPIAPASEWQDELLTPAAFPAWFIARQAMLMRGSISFVKRDQLNNGHPVQRNSIAKGRYGYLD